MRLPKWIAGACAALMSLSCLPSDTRTPPASLLVEASASDMLLHGFVTEDGWSLTFDRFLLSLGHTSLEGCTSYTDDGYGRILDLMAGPDQRVSLLYGLGQCRFSFRISHPNSESVLGEGVTERDQSFMRTPNTEDDTDQGISVHVEGNATKNGEKQHFAWSLRRKVEVQAVIPSAETEASSLTLSKGDAKRLLIEIRGEELFRVSESGQLVFGVFADADENADGEVTLTELEGVSVESRGENAMSLADWLKHVGVPLLPYVAVSDY